MSKIKFIKFSNDVVYVFPESAILSHVDVANIGRKHNPEHQIKSAGFCHWKEGAFHSYGNSVSLRVDSEDGDGQLLTVELDGGYKIYLTEESGIVLYDTWILTNDHLFANKISQLKRKELEAGVADGLRVLPFLVTEMDDDETYNEMFYSQSFF